MTYYVIGLMSGSAHDGLDICYTHLSFVSGKKWEYTIEQATCILYPDTLKQRLKNASELSVPEFLKLDVAFARFCAEQVNQFIAQHDLTHRVFFIASHGHTVWHEPSAHVSTQIGDGATIAALTGYTTISDLRNMDVALGGQGAPIAPVADRLLFPEYDFCLNLGGIANVTVNREEPVAFDICPANQLLDYFAQKQGLPFDDSGTLAAEGNCNEALLARMDSHAFYQQPAPKSLDNTFSTRELIPLLDGEKAADALQISVQHIAHQVARALSPYVAEGSVYKMLITGGGAWNTYLVEQIRQSTGALPGSVSCEVPDDGLVAYKEALAMALIGALRWREEENVLATVTGASRNSIGGALWLGR